MPPQGWPRRPFSHELIGSTADLSHVIDSQSWAKLRPFCSSGAGKAIAQLASVRPLVTFVIPVYNDALRLERCLSSIVRNEYPRELIQMIIVDNDSTDGSASAARRHGAIVLHSSGGSRAALRNRGAGAGLGKIMAFVDSDHEIDRHWIETAVAMLSDPNVAAAGFAWLGSGSFAVKRSAFERVGGFDDSLTACEDVNLCNRLRLAGLGIVADPELRSIHFGDATALKALA